MFQHHAQNVTHLMEAVDLTDASGLNNRQSRRLQVLSQHEEGARYRRLRLLAPQIARTAQPGQFLHLLTNDVSRDETHSFHPLLRRAFSVMKCGPDWVELLYRLEGLGTHLLAAKGAGDTVDALGPLGQPFRVQRPHLLLVGGGVGVPPLLFVAQKARETSVVSRETIEIETVEQTPLIALLRVEAFIGARSADDVMVEHEMQSLVDALWIATEDGSKGEKGFITAPLERRLKALGREASSAQVCACGPLAMLRAVAQVCRKFGVLCQVSLEENMPCGIGVCNGCVIPVQGSGDDYEKYRRVCVDGPVMNADEILWEPEHSQQNSLPVQDEHNDDMEAAEHRGASQ